MLLSCSLTCSFLALTASLYLILQLLKFDITFIITYLYLEGEAPWPVNAADANCDLVVNIFDITYLITYLYLGGEEPCYLEE